MLIALLLLTGCATLTPSSQARISEALLASCPDLVGLSDGDFKSVVDHLVYVAGEYHECKAKHRGLSEAVK